MKKFKDNVCKEGEASSSKHTFGKKKRIKYFHYKNKGHMIKDCKIRIVVAKVVVAKQTNVIERNEKLYVATTLNVTIDKVFTWYLDTGVVQHMSFDRKLFILYEKWGKRHVFYLGDNSTQDIHDQGEVTIKSSNGDIRKIHDGA